MARERDKYRERREPVFDDAAIEACTTDAAYAQGLVDWYTENAERDGITSTPSFLINGVKYTNMAYEDFAAILDTELAK
mgnify:CR=1 FL=1